MEAIVFAVTLLSFAAGAAIPAFAEPAEPRHLQKTHRAGRPADRAS